jgi:hypothetical protein
VTRTGVDFAEAYARFLDFAGDSPIAAFGRDELVLLDNLRLYGIAQDARRSAGVLQSARLVRGAGARSARACSRATSPRRWACRLSVHTHNALNDARSLAAGMAALAASGGARSAPRVGAAA